MSFLIWFEYLTHSGSHNQTPTVHIYTYMYTHTYTQMCTVIYTHMYVYVRTCVQTNPVAVITEPQHIYAHIQHTCIKDTWHIYY